MKKYEVFDHTADVGIIAHGKDLNEAFENAALGMFGIITDVDKIEKVGEFRVELKAQDMEQLLVDWLSELLFIQTVDNVMLSKFGVDISQEHGEFRLAGAAEGEGFDPKRHTFHVEIKAVTHHMLDISKNDGYRIKVLFDI
ncbi:MAG: archease [Thermoplasmata archaeon]|nr:MAG: archease [Thermoplasmata archaeon]